jgi:hypothetical protein
MDRSDITAHGFRSTFRDWAAERTNFPREVAEAALAHAIDNKVEAAYRRGNLFDKRRRLMAAWAEFLAKEPANEGKVVALRGTGQDRLAADRVCSPTRLASVPAFRRTSMRIAPYGGAMCRGAVRE